MLNIYKLVTIPTVVNGIHESVYRNAAILDIVEQLLKRKTPPLVVLDLLQEMRGLVPCVKIVDVEHLTPAPAGNGA